MKKAIITLMLAACLLSAQPSAAEAEPEVLTKEQLTNPTHGHLYPDAAVITALDYSTDTVYVQDAVGYVYSFKGCEDYTEGELMALIMFGAGGPTIEDDVVVEARYTGYCL